MIYMFQGKRIEEQDVSGKEIKKLGDQKPDQLPRVVGVSPSLMGGTSLTRLTKLEPYMEAILRLKASIIWPR